MTSTIPDIPPIWRLKKHNTKNKGFTGKLLIARLENANVNKKEKGAITDLCTQGVFTYLKIKSKENTGFPTTLWVKKGWFRLFYKHDPLR